tara:strand:- start:9631 stop:10092 length:462 start_codon:yes stop_codon:yes gene_type:complete
MPSPEYRESREVKRGTGEVWRAAALGMLNSTDVDARGRLLAHPPDSSHLAHSPISNLPPLPSLPRSAISPVVSVRADTPNTASLRPTPPRSAPPTARPALNALYPSAGNAIVETMAREITALEIQNSALKKTMKVQRELIRGFCKLHVDESRC